MGSNLPYLHRSIIDLKIHSSQGFWLIIRRIIWCSFPWPCIIYNKRMYLNLKNTKPPSRPYHSIYNTTRYKRKKNQAMMMCRGIEISSSCEWIIWTTYACYSQECLGSVFMQSCRNGTEIRVESHLVFQWTFTVLDGPPSWLPLVTFMLDPLCSFHYVILEASLLVTNYNDQSFRKARCLISKCKHSKKVGVMTK